MENKKQIEYRFDVKTDGKKATVYIYGDILDEQPRNWITGELEENIQCITPEKIRNALSEIEEEEIEIHLNSYGGSVFASIAIYNYLANLKDKTITTVNDGICASGASLILCAGSTVKMYKNTMLMIHRASSYAWGNCNDLRKVADTLENLDNSTALETYVSRFNGTKEELMNLIDKETWINAEEAKEKGLVDEVLELKTSKKEATDTEIKNAKNMMYAFANLKIKEIK